MTGIVHRGDAEARRKTSRKGRHKVGTRLVFLVADAEGAEVAEKCCVTFMTGIVHRGGAEEDLKKGPT